MLRMLQWVGLSLTVLALIVLAWPGEAEADFTIDSSSMIMDFPQDLIPLVVVTDAKSGELRLRVKAEEVRLPDHPDTPIGLSVHWEDGSGHILREGIGLRIETAGKIDADLEIKTQSDLHLQVETSSGMDVANLRIGLPAYTDEIVLRW